MTDLVLELLQAARDRIENAPLLRAPNGSELRCPAVAEHALEHDLRIDLHRQRTRRRLPGNRIRVDAAVALTAVARVRARVLDGQLQRRQQRLLADPLRDDLIDRGARLDVGTRRLLGLGGAQIGSRDEMIGAGDTRRILCGLRPEAARQNDVLAERCQ